MRYKILLYGLIAAAITSCSSVYKASQTPDDVYYSPAKAGVEKETVKRDRNRNQYEDYIASEDDQYLRMKVRGRERWSGIDDYTYWNDSRYVPSYNFNYDYYRNNLYNTYAWNNWYRPYSGLYYDPYVLGGYGGGFGGLYITPSYYPRYGYGYNPYGGGYISKNPTGTIAPSVGRPNLSGYRNGLYDNSNTNRSNQGIGNTLKRVFTPNENARTYSNENSTYRSENTNTYSSPARSYTPSSSSSSSGSSSSGSSSGGGVSRPPR